MKSAVRAGLGTAGGELDAASNDIFMQEVKRYGSWEEPEWLVWSKGYTHTHSGHGWEGSACDCLKAEDAAVQDAGGNLGLVPHILNYVIPEGCRGVCHRYAGNLHWEVAQWLLHISDPLEPLFKHSEGLCIWLRQMSHPQLSTGGPDCRRLLQLGMWECPREFDAQLVLANEAADLWTSWVVFLEKCLYRMIYVGSRLDSCSEICFLASSLYVLS